MSLDNDELSTVLQHIDRVSGTEWGFRRRTKDALSEADDTFGVFEQSGWEFLGGIGMAVFAHTERDAVVWRSGGSYIVTTKEALHLLGVIEIAYQTSEAYCTEVASEVEQ